MILVDTSVWIEYLSRGEPRLSGLLEDGQVLGHPFVAGELACGQLRNRFEVLDLLGRLPQASTARHSEVLGMLERERLYGRGLAWIDVHLLASARSAACALWSLDAELSRCAEALGIETA